MFPTLLDNQWASASASSAPTSYDKKFYNMAPEYEEYLNTHDVDDPVVALASSSQVHTDSDEALKPEEKRLEITLKRGHQANAWAIRTATSASFFNRASLRWLRQLKQSIPNSNLRAHRDMAKIKAAMEFSADATFNAVKFSARAMASQVAARRLLWLKHWQADIKNKWRLASAPIEKKEVIW
uniref:Lamina-associated polypeptide 2 alpha C-terminal domain-containing protein n=1 Tax=Micrurus surinamensis TaxID=129470 RepID=A0A2D4PTA0_MICSU